jgi:hypothetical protein
MPQRAWSSKRERHYERIKAGLKTHGRSEPLAEEIAARTVNKDRARSGEATKSVERRPVTSRPSVVAACVRTEGRAGEPGTSCTRKPAGRTSTAARR